MEIVKQIVVPTGAIFTAIGGLNRQLEFLYVGDYGETIALSIVEDIKEEEAKK